MCLHLFLLFLPAYLGHRNLHSFPTRRSSDLLGIPDGSLVISILRDGTGFVPLADSVIEPGDEVLLVLDSGDRKSTRLNSSHVSISYAVFCLKKKNASRLSVSHSSGSTDNWHL